MIVIRKPVHLAEIARLADAQDHRAQKAVERAEHNRHLDWLREHAGSAMMASFDKQVIRAIRNQFLNEPTKGNAILKRLSQLWIFAEEFCGLHLPMNPVREVQKLDTNSEAATAWPPEVCAAWETDANETDLTFYMLARYTGQRKGDCCDMRRSDIDLKGNRIHLVQEKTGMKMWVPLHKRLKQYLAALPRRGDHILTSPVTGKRYSKQSITNYITARMVKLGFPGHSAHGLRHAAGVALAEAGCKVDQIMAILGHVTEAQALHYMKQARQSKLADAGMARNGRRPTMPLSTTSPSCPRPRPANAATRSRPPLKSSKQTGFVTRFFHAQKCFQ